MPVGGFLQTLRNLGPIRLAAIGGVIIALIAFFMILTTRMSDGEMALLYGDLDLTDSAEIAAVLEAEDTPFRVAQNGTAIMVPKDQVDRLRLIVAGQGLPSGGSLGYEIFDRSEGFGTTNFVQNINRLRALEGELARTIGTISGVRQARVHLVLPERQLFSREAQSPSASVFLRLAGAGLSSEQILAIQHLVASSVPRLAPDAISIVDHHGNLLARGPAGSAEDLLRLSSEETRLAEERRMRQTIEELLARSVGYGKVRANVSIDMDFDRVTTNEEIFDPESAVARSTQLVEDETLDNSAGGIDPVTVANNLPEGGTPDAAAGASESSRATRSQETVNYEISTTVRSTVRDVGTVRRLSVAVLVDGTYTEDANGDVVYVPRSESELAQLETLVQSAVGYDPERGDVVEVINMEFVPLDEFGEEEEPGWLSFAGDGMFRIAEIVVLGVVATLVILLVVRPLINRLLESDRRPAAPVDDLSALLSDETAAQRALLGGPEGSTDLAGAGAVAMAESPSELDHLIDLSQVEGRVRASSLRKIGEIVEKHPDEAASIIRSWLYQDA